ncbi:efflux RND transporter periplasmic adaptor subunit [uncultured Sphingomonas sp.]|uniref:efflux RND transporter periplasmic adaptor subunit n=1 Tax=uncultured Sphingomonas sp. TaxID=158754 RepID=UPI00262ACC88|nr:efflux RND transporter periplasmic adaptor subunit [uncultured Sphingomonas sp.]
MTKFASAIAVALLLSACGAGSPPAQQGPAQVSVVTVRSQPVTLTTELPGRTVAYETSEVRPQVNGLILARLFEEGDSVRQGQPLYRIDPQPYKASEASAAAALARAKAAIASTSALARRYDELVKINAVARQDYDNAVTQAAQARADVSAQEAALNSARIDLGRTIIRAPISGRIGRSDFTTGALVTASQANALTTIQRLDPIYVDVQQSSADVLKLRQQIMAGHLSREGGAARVRLKLEDGTTYPIEGELKFTDVSVDPATGSQAIRIRFANPNGLLLPGMYVRAELVEGTQARGMLVPQRTVSRDERGHPTVMLVGKDGKVEQRVIQTTRTIGDSWLVTGGLKDGEKIVVEGGMMLRPGMPVKAVAYSPKDDAAPAKPAAAAQAK